MLKKLSLVNSDWLKLNTTIYPYNMIVALIRLNKPKKNSLWNCVFFFNFSRLASLERIYMDTNIIKDNLLQAPRWPSGHVSQLMNAFTHGTIKTCATTWCVSDQILHSTHLYLSYHVVSGENVSFHDRHVYCCSYLCILLF